MSIRSIPVWSLALAAAIVAIGVIAIVALGSDGESEEGPAELVPASVPVYVDLTVRPEGEAREGAEAALGRILDTEDTASEIVSAIEREARQEGEEFDYEQDVEPWLGERVAVFATTIGAEGTDSDAAVVIETTDPDAALEFIRSHQDSPGQSREHDGVEYEVDPDGDASGIVDDFLVGGSENAFRAAVDARDGDSLAESDEFNEGLDELPDDRLATLYVPPREFLDALPEGQVNEQGLNFLRRVADDALEQPVVGAMTASESEIAFEATAAGGDFENEESSLLASVPADAWLAFGFGDVGGLLERAIASLDDAGLDEDTVRSQVQAQTGLDLDTIIEALGDGVLYVEGTSEPALEGAVLIEDRDEAASAEVIRKVGDLIRRQSDLRVGSAPGGGGLEITDPSGELPKPIEVVQREGRVVIGYGPASLEGAVEGGETLESNPAFESAQGTLEDLGLDVFLDLQSVFELAESEGASSDPEYRRAKRYIDGLDYVAVGSGSDDDKSTISVIVGLAE